MIPELDPRTFPIEPLLRQAVSLDLDRVYRAKRSGPWLTTRS